jgi:hypothetical protein
VALSEVERLEVELTRHFFVHPSLRLVLVTRSGKRLPTSLSLFSNGFYLSPRLFKKAVQRAADDMGLPMPQYE